MTSTAETTFTLCYQAIPAEDLHRIRAAGFDDFGHPLQARVNQAETGTPLRCCLREAKVGDRVALISWQPLAEALESVYAEIGPVFIHADECAGFRDDGTYPDGFRRRQQVLRSYTATGDMHETALANRAEAEDTIRRLLADPEAAVVHSRNVLAGCYMFAIRRG